jgi:hypothetical protein
VAELERLDGLERAKKMLSKRINDPKVMFVPGLKDDLRAILDGFEEIERRVATVASVVVRKHFGESKLDETTWLAVERIAAGAKHGPDCKCMRCLLGRL